MRGATRVAMVQVVLWVALATPGGLLRLLAAHPQAQVDVITSRAEEGMPVADMFPNPRPLRLAFLARRF